jgi:glyoxylase-like metal-dependent hydrolase (beta-lactamase superfamily II)
MSKDYAIEPGKKYQIGDVTLETIRDGGISGHSPEELAPGLRDLLNKNKEALKWLYPVFANEETGELLGSTQSFLIKSEGKNILIDTGVNVPGTRYDDELYAAGCTYEDIDDVMFTHMHDDHIARNCVLGVGGTWEPSFANARYFFYREHYEFLKELQDDHSQQTGIPEGDHLGSFRTQILPLVEQGKVDFVEKDFTLHDVISLYPLPGHMSGHIGMMIKSKGDSAIIAGDLYLHEFQMTLLDWSAPWGNSPEVSKRTRENLFASLANRDTLFWSCHSASGGFVVTQPDGSYRLIAH